MTFIQHSRRCFEGFEMEGEDDLLLADFIDGCWEVTKKPNVLCTGESNVYFRCFTFIFSDSKEVTGCDLGLLFQNNETADVEFEKLGQGGNRFKFWCKNATQRLVQKEAPYHKASCALDFLH